MSVEKNDVDVSKLFSWSRPFEIVGLDDEVETVLYMRLLGDADLNRARVYALRRSMELRKKLKDDDSDERLAYLVDKDMIDEEQLRKFIILFNMRPISQKVQQEINLPYPKPIKSTASLEEQEKYQKAIDEYQGKKSKMISNMVDKEVKSLEKTLKGMNKDALYKEYSETFIAEMCEQEVLKAFNEMATFLGVYKDEDCTERFFNDFEKFKNLPPSIKEDFISAYQTLEMGADELKKLRGVTQ